MYLASFVIYSVIVGFWLVVIALGIYVLDLACRAANYGSSLLVRGLGYTIVFLLTVVIVFFLGVWLRERSLIKVRYNDH
jgi:hypothetical protein